ncbi:YncE family protein [Beijerinckia indica]|uniref:YncE family protein n=1 Tax=Beijerinckia indica TaxID=533 RepID=UPI0002FC0A15|nr:YncE family protein [Beijerinckia indica]
MNRIFFQAIAAMSLVAAAQAATLSSDSPVSFVRSTSLPAVSGGFDHFAVDQKNDRLFVAAEKNKSIEMFELASGKHLASIGGFSNPRTIAMVPELNQILVADNDSADVKVLDVATQKIIQSIPVRPGPDAAFYDKKEKLFYVGSGGKKEKSENSSLNVISADDHKEVARIEIPSTNIESMAMDRAEGKLFLNLRDKQAIGVVDLKTRKFVETWQIPGLNLNTPMAFDSKNHRLFVVGRKPGKLFVIDSTNGKLVSTVDVVDTGDDMTYDKANNRIYVTGAEGLSVLRRDDNDHFTEIERKDTKGGKVSVYVSKLHQFYIMHPKSDADDAALDIYNVEDVASSK